MKPPTTTLRPKCRGAAPLWTYLVVVLVILLTAVGVLGYVVYSSFSKQAALQRELQAVKDAQTQQEISEKRDELSRQEAEQAVQRAMAQNSQKEALTSAQSATNRLFALLGYSRALQVRIASVTTGDPGKQVAQFPDLILAARRVVDEAKTIPTPTTIQQRLEAARRVEYEIRQKLGTAYDPGPVKDGIEQDLQWASRWLDSVKSLDSALDSLKADAETKLPLAPSNQTPGTLQEAIDAQIAAETRARQELISRSKDQAVTEGDQKIAQAVYDKTLAEKQAEADLLAQQVKQLEAELERQKLQLELAIQHSNTVTQAAAAKIAAETEAIRLRAKAQEPEVVAALRPFTTPGYWNPGGKLTTDLKPMSLKAIQAVGALNRSEKGILKLQDVATTKSDAIRPRMDRDRLRRNQQRYGEYSELQALLIELGSTLVELKMLEP